MEGAIRLRGRCYRTRSDWATDRGPAGAALADSTGDATSSTGGTLVIRTQAQPATAGVVTPQVSSSMADGNHTISASSSGNHISNSFKSTVNIANWGTYAELLSGTATTKWTGSGKGTVDIDNHYWVTGLFVTVSVPFGASGNIFNEGVDYKGHQTNSTKTTDTASGAVWSGPLFTFNENETADWSVSGNSYHLTTN
ncbi:hypothetical protein [Gryllotalpicola sp.]|uniref:hypothetical protein n=1 Tax=Gryllotalpicola sp. TaxID=1932787 RepID=UPI00262AB86E|nr:hypothetical protein [Gryllotalpicola sp.]